MMNRTGSTILKQQMMRRRRVPALNVLAVTTNSRSRASTRGQRVILYLRICVSVRKRPKTLLGVLLSHDAARAAAFRRASGPDYAFDFPREAQETAVIAWTGNDLQGAR
jgi:hypothetical protein